VAEKLSTRKELRQPDALQRAGLEAREWIQQRRRAVIIGVAAVILIALGAALASYLSDRGEDRAAKDLGAALKILDRPVAENAQADATPGNEAPFRSQGEKDQSAVKSLSDFRSQHPGTRGAVTAALPLADALYRLGDYDQALVAYSEFLKKAREDDPLRAAALEGEGYTYEAKGQLDQALSSFDQLSKMKSEFLAGMGTFHRGRILALQGKKDEAAKVFAELVAAHPSSAAARMAQERIAVLASEGVKIPSVAPAADAGV